MNLFALCMKDHESRVHMNPIEPKNGQSFWKKDLVSECSGKRYSKNLGHYHYYHGNICWLLALRQLIVMFSGLLLR